MGRPANSPEVLWSKVDVRGEDECWPWLGFKNEQGYGRTWINDRGYYAHRVIFDLANPGVIVRSAPRVGSGSAGFVRHSCDNPSCCNPKHLSIGTHKQNMEDKQSRGRARLWADNPCASPRAKLDSEQIAEIRRLGARKLTHAEIAKVFGVSRPTISSALSGRTYAGVA